MPLKQVKLGFSMAFMEGRGMLWRNKVIYLIFLKAPDEQIIKKLIAENRYFDVAKHQIKSPGYI